MTGEEYGLVKKRFMNVNGRCNPSDLVELYRKVFPVKSVVKNYDIMTYGKIGDIFLKKYPVQDLEYHGYVYDIDNRIPENELFDFQKDWLKNKNIRGWKRFDRYCYHSYGVHSGYFRPNLLEVIKLFENIIRNNDVVIVTTEPCDEYGRISENMYNMYDFRCDKHRGVTTAWIEKKNE